ncbi:MAG: NADH-quinone oxidoreductase subunit C [Chloroflexota bacterium]
MRRLLLPDDWQGFPLRYDHPIGGEEVGFTS